MRRKAWRLHGWSALWRRDRRLRKLTTRAAQLLNV